MNITLTAAEQAHVDRQVAGGESINQKEKTTC